VAGAIAGAGLISTCMPGNLNASTSLAATVTYSQGIFLEAICTMQLIFAVLMVSLSHVLQSLPF
jgi:glycerol uptake facilitator-like aquaporin